MKGKQFAIGLTLSLLFCTSLNAQEVVSSAGHTISNSYYNFDWTVGEVTVITIEGQDHAFTQGFNQPQLEEEPIPTLGEWGLIFLGLFLFIFGSLSAQSRSAKML